MIDEAAAYTRAINTRAEKIVATLNISDSPTAKHVTQTIADQYRKLNSVYTERDEQIKLIKSKGETKEVTDAEIKKIESNASTKITVLHNDFLSSLSKKLSQEQVTKVKDGMTYNECGNLQRIC
jgi:F0F1-type ATP synthase gamma subunit